jgi:hypothetical protein
MAVRDAAKLMQEAHDVAQPPRWEKERGAKNACRRCVTHVMKKHAVRTNPHVVSDFFSRAKTKKMKVGGS